VSLDLICVSAAKLLGHEYIDVESFGEDANLKQVTMALRTLMDALV
jgi:hypothetical protein